MNSKYIFLIVAVLAVGAISVPLLMFDEAPSPSGNPPVFNTPDQIKAAPKAPKLPQANKQNNMKGQAKKGPANSRAEAIERTKDRISYFEKRAKNAKKEQGKKRFTNRANRAKQHLKSLQNMTDAEWQAKRIEKVKKQQEKQQQQKQNAVKEASPRN